MLWVIININGIDCSADGRSTAIFGLKGENVEMFFDCVNLQDLIIPYGTNFPDIEVGWEISSNLRETEIKITIKHRCVSKNIFITPKDIVLGGNRVVIEKLKAGIDQLKGECLGTV